jgi:hypothetical protein
VTMFNLAGMFWGRIYLIGVGLFALALLLPLKLEWAPVIVGLGMSAVMAYLGWHLRKVGAPKG